MTTKIFCEKVMLRVMFIICKYITEIWKGTWNVKYELLKCIKHAKKGACFEEKKSSFLQVEANAIVVDVL